MTKDNLPEPFDSYWKMKQTPMIETAPLNKEVLSKEWVNFLKAVGDRVEDDLIQKEK
ncbi:hypothetical protein [Anaerobacillus alkaliphilus]|uniref:hypothetical protein n=1 Tax=Anaerobacillus alkaliphilus TaxID=1548597 RepID=UPI001375D9B5|nr:hypothetical protein [Anaerobacillus alkaliphilus]